ncbi:DUF5723 family protein [Nemorincola caseinilytica]|uniref:DUF5723 family protein n=1 Tax=Nemorincola caseinilytica TaxID=2054315 RepID=A0ABP8N5Q6_9BACT
MKLLPQLHQSQWFNASNQTDVKISVGLPVLSGTSFYIFNSGFTYNSLFHRVNDSTMSIHPSSFIDKLKNRNMVAFGANVSILSANVAFEKYTIGFSVTDRVDARFTYPKDLFRFAWYGNGAYIGESLNIGNFGLNASWYREYALHGTYNYGKWVFGASPKLLFGKTNINTKESYLQVYTDADYYAITAQTEMNIQTSGFADSADRAEGRMAFPGYAFNSKNMGLGIDLGASYQLNDKIKIAGGINNLGYIKWKSNIHGYKAGPKSITFEGFDLANMLQGDSSEFISTSQYLDSVKNMLKFTKNTDPYKTSLPVEFYAVGSYDINNKHTVGAQLSIQSFSKRALFATTVYYRLNLSKHFSGVLTYTLKSASPFNLGGAIVARFAGMQWYLSTDNWWASIRPLDSKNMNVNLGVNLAFGDRTKKK